ncbi:tail assembly protein [Salmonella enterica]|nr:tail assembly protein [Salmonella enterica]
MATTDAFNMAVPAMAKIRLYGDLQRFGRSFSLSVKTAAEGLHALFVQVPGLRGQIAGGWYRVRISGQDISPDEISARLHEPLAPGAVIHIVPRMEGAKNGGFFQFVAGAVLAVVGYALGWTGIGAIVGSVGVSMMLGGVAQMLTPKPQKPGNSTADNGKQNTYFSSLDNMIAQGNPVPVPYGEIMTGSRRISQELSTRDESSPDKIVRFGRNDRFMIALGGRAAEHNIKAHAAGIHRPRVIIR